MTDSTSGNTEPDEVRTARLLLRRVRADDLAAALEIHTDPENYRYEPNGAPSATEARGLLTSWLAHWAEHGFGYWAIELPGTGEVIGFGGVRLSVSEDDGTEQLNLYYRFRPAAWGNGYAPEMAAAAIEWADRCVPGRPITIIANVENTPSNRVAEKLGFVVVGKLDDGRGPAAWVHRRQDAVLSANR
ncbi:GNAT family N-acetyltransferase [Solihabitans fulvus]|uniref:GNAT family N-acetyltransferase n=1 Tax=Solihabitans fulvus TaxID=1892852 RepID=A0A5B2X9C8_9PSEU|nr:GNAT family N-acetyltransferase [Solihabitans fulvus]KAA2259462.1 GNAT family N-acetyltransferase [Solihabitans fulvus]